MQWKELKAQLLETGSARLTGEPADRFIATSTAGPGRAGRDRYSLPWAITGSSLRLIPGAASRSPTAVAAWPTCTIAISSCPAAP